MSEVMECTSCGFKNWQTTCWSCNAVLPVTKQVEELKAENERLREEVESNCMAANFWWREAYRANKQELPRPSKEKDRECLKRIAELESAEAERDELREALSHIRDFPWSASNVQAVARQALWQPEGGGDDE